MTQRGLTPACAGAYPLSGLSRVDTRDNNWRETWRDAPDFVAVFVKNGPEFVVGNGRAFRDAFGRHV